MEITPEVIKNLYIHDSYAREIFDSVARAIIELRGLEEEVLRGIRRDDRETSTTVYTVGKDNTTILARVGEKAIGELEGMTVSVSREVMPIFIMGNPRPVTFTKGKRAIAGNLVFKKVYKSNLRSYGDNMPPFDVYIENDEGVRSVLGITIIDDAFGVAPRDLKNGEAYTFIARSVL